MARTDNKTTTTAPMPPIPEGETLDALIAYLELLLKAMYEKDASRATSTTAQG